MSSTDFLLLLGKCSAQAAVLALLVLLVQRLFRKQLSPGWRSALWLVVLLRLIPFSLVSPSSLFNVLPDWKAPAQTPTAIQPSTQPVAPAVINQPSTEAEPEYVVAPQTVPLPTPFPARATPISTRLADFTEILFFTWAGACVLLLACTFYNSWRFSRSLRRSRLIDDARLQALLHDCAQALGVSKIPALYECEAVSSPAVYGILQPRILLPVGLTRDFSEEQLRFIFLHELAHLRRRDIPLSWCASFLLALHWFNPAVWLVLNRWRNDREEACDAMALEAAGCEQRMEYGHTMLQMLERVGSQRFVPSALGILESRGQLRRRIATIASHMPRRGWPILAVLLVGGLAAIGLTDAQKQKSEGDFRYPVREITITVEDGETGKAIEGVLVTAPFVRLLAIDPKIYDATHKTDSSGKMRVEIPTWMLNSPDYQSLPLYIVHPDYAPQAMRWQAKNKALAQFLPEEVTVKLHKGESIGGVVLDSLGSPVAGAKVSINGENSLQDKQPYDYSRPTPYSCIRDEDVVVLTDENGRWTMSNFPGDVTTFSIQVQRKEGGSIRFHQLRKDAATQEEAQIFDPRDAYKRAAVFMLPKGKSIRGLVVDEAGQPVAGARVLIGGGTTPQSLETGSNGSFEVLQWMARNASLCVKKPGFADKPVFLEDISQAGDTRIILSKAKPLTLQVTDENEQPLANALVSTDLRRFTNLDAWRGVTDVEGRVTWETAPVGQIPLTIHPSESAFEHTRLVDTGQQEVKIRLRNEAYKNISVKLQVSDSKTGAPVERFDVLCWTRNGWELFGKPGTQGQFASVIEPKDFQQNFNGNLRLQIRAAGYISWKSASFLYTDGDQNMAVQLRQGMSIEPDERPFPRSSELRSDAADAALIKAYSEAVCELLATGDLDHYTSKCIASEDDWNALLSARKKADDGDVNIRSFKEATIKRDTNSARSLGERFLKMARSCGIGNEQFKIKSIRTSPPSTIRTKSVGTGSVKLNLPVYNLIRVELERPAGKPEECYEFEIVMAEKFPTGLRNGIVQWVTLPVEKLDGLSMVEFGLMNKLGTQMSAVVTTSDDPAITSISDEMTSWLKDGTPETLLNIALPGDPEKTKIRETLGNRRFDSIELIFRENRDRLRQAAVDFVDGNRESGINLNNAEIRLIQASAEGVRLINSDEVCGIRALRMKFVFQIRYPNDNKPVKRSGIHTLVTGEALRVNDRWYLMGSKFQWQEPRAASLAANDKAIANFANFISENMPLPVKTDLNTLSLPKLDGSGAVKIGDLHGRFVVLLFWNPSQETSQDALTEIQAQLGEHPEWEGKITLVTVSLDEQAASASDYLSQNPNPEAIHCWTGIAGSYSETAKKLRIRETPTVGLIDTEGKSIFFGHPASLPDKLSKQLQPAVAVHKR